MKNINFVKDVLPHAVAIAIFLILTVGYYQPMVFDGLEIRQNDVLQGIGGGEEVGSFRRATGEEALWTNSMFSGMPAYMINISWSDPLVSIAQKVLTLGFSSHAGITLMAMLCFYLMLIFYGVNPWLALLGGIAYGFNSFNIISIEAGHIWKMRAIAYMPLLVGGLHLIFKSSKHLLWGFVITALAMALELGANHLQITYYLAFVLALLGLNAVIVGIKDGDYKLLGKQLAVGLIAVGLGVGANVGRIWSAYEYSQYSTRGESNLSQEGTSNVDDGLERDYVFAWSQGVGESMTFMIPYYYGGASSEPLDQDSEVGLALQRNQVPAQQANQFLQGVPTYRGDQPFTSAPIYLGAILCFLFILGMITLPHRQRWWLLGITLLGFMLAWGKNFQALNYALYDFFPLYNKFRSVSMALVIPLLTMPLAGILGLHYWTKLDKKQALQYLGIALGVSLFILLIAVVMAGDRGPRDAQLAENPWLLKAIRESRTDLLRGDAGRAFLFILLAAVSMLAYALGRTKEIALGISLSIFVALDLIPVDRRYLNDENFVRSPKEQWLTATPADQAIKNAGLTHYRVLNLNNPFNEARTSSQHSSIGGYHGAKLKRYQELIDRVLGQQVQQTLSTLQGGNRDLSQFGALNMLNMQFIKFGDQANAVLRNNAAFGNAWFVDTILPVGTADEEMAQVGQLRSDSVAIIDLDANGLSQAPATGTGTITLTEYKPNQLTYSVNSTSGGLAVFSEVYYPKGWEATIDGEPVEILRANYLLRALQIPAGAKTVEFTFEPRVYTTGNRITLISNIIIGIGLLGAIGLTFYRRKEEDEEETK